MAVAFAAHAVTLRFVSSFGLREGLGRPCGIAIGPGNVIHVADSGYGRVLRFREDGSFLDKFGAGEGGWLRKVGQLRNATGVAVDTAGYSWVTDVGLQHGELGNALSKFDPQGRFVLKVGRKGTSEGEFDRPRSVRIDPDGCLWVADAYNHRVQKFDADGGFLMAFGHRGDDPAGGGALNDPSDIAFDEHGLVYVTDTFNDRIQIFDRDGHFVGQFGRRGTGEGQFMKPRGIAIADGRIFVTEVEGHRLQAFDPEGGFLASFGSQGWRDGQFNMPYGVAVLGRELLVADNQNRRIVRLGLE
jgi:tripartite motif-containing protein 71